MLKDYYTVVKTKKGEQQYEKNKRVFKCCFRVLRWFLQSNSLTRNIISYIIIKQDNIGDIIQLKVDFNILLTWYRPYN